MTFKEFFEARLNLTEAVGRGGITGWVVPFTNTWIPVVSYHNHPEYIGKIAPELQKDSVASPSHKEYMEYYDDEELGSIYEQQEAKIPQVINDYGAVRVAWDPYGTDPSKEVKTLYLVGRDINQLNKAYKMLYKMFGKKVLAYKVVEGEIMDKKGDIIQRANLKLNPTDPENSVFGGGAAARSELAQFR
jgi:hypothetical protein